jgi:2',3'-cyclic-nucleotide 2'-phosphodiesterase/3'-nucleotidase
VLGTTDLHGNVFDWDYFTDAEYAEYDDKGRNDIGLAKVDPITGENGPVHPMAQAMNAIGYDAAALGNHEFNYGIPLLLS